MADYLTPNECADEINVSVMTVIRWINKGFKGTKLFARRCGWQWRINPETWRSFLWKTGQLVKEGQNGQMERELTANQSNHLPDRSTAAQR